MSATTDCAGTWQLAPTPSDDGDLVVYACSGCSAWWVHIGQTAITVDAGRADTTEAAVRIALTEKAMNQ